MMLVPSILFEFDPTPDTPVEGPSYKIKIILGLSVTMIYNTFINLDIKSFSISNILQTKVTFRDTQFSILERHFLMRSSHLSWWLCLYFISISCLCSYGSKQRPCILEVHIEEQAPPLPLYQSCWSHPSNLCFLIQFKKGSNGYFKHVKMADLN